MREIDGVLYCNDGDWVESLTALVEHFDGRLEIIDRGDQAALPGMLPAPKSKPTPMGLPVPAVAKVTTPDSVSRPA